jgi:hypothetical protein
MVTDILLTLRMRVSGTLRHRREEFFVALRVGDRTRIFLVRTAADILTATK